MKIALAQMKSVVGNIDANCQHYRSFVVDATRSGCELIVFPEMTDTGYVMSVIMNTACTHESMPFKTLSSLAKEFKISIVAGISEREADHVYNSTVVFDSQGGFVAKHRKTHLFTACPVYEHKYLSFGNSLTVTSIAGVRVGIFVCYELRFPEIARALMKLSADLIIVPAAWPMSRLRHWNTLIAARAIENQLYVAAVNRVGSDESLVFAGSSQIVDPYGTVLAAASEFEESVIVAEVNLDRIHEVRSIVPALPDIRPEIADVSFQRVDNV